MSEPSEYPGERTDLQCGECQAAMKLRPSRYGVFYGCTRWPECDGKHGAHKQSGAPLGTPADKATRKARIRAHGVFDLVWKQKLVKNRGAAYKWMREALDMSKREAHISHFTLEQCEALIAAVLEAYPVLRTRHTMIMYGEDF